MNPPAPSPAVGIRSTLRSALFIVVAMFGFGFALVPLYDVLCQVTGLNGKTSGVVAQAEPMRVDEARTVTVEFVASVNLDAPWEFHPDVTKLQVHPGRFYTTHFYARNRSARAVLGQAIPSVSPGPAATHFHKIECFCFTQQGFAAGEGREMPVTFRIDPQLPADVHTVTLSYTFFRLPEQG